jgi:hypothetical protein
VSSSRQRRPRLEADVWFEHEQGNAEAACTAHQQALDGGHDDVAPQAAVTLGVLEQQGDPVAASTAYRQAIATGHPEEAARASAALGPPVRGKDQDHGGIGRDLGARSPHGLDDHIVGADRSRLRAARNHDTGAAEAVPALLVDVPDHSVAVHPARQLRAAGVRARSRTRV